MRAAVLLHEDGRAGRAEIHIAGEHQRAGLARQHMAALLQARGLRAVARIGNHLHRIPLSRPLGEVERFDRRVADGADEAQQRNILLHEGNGLVRIIDIFGQDRRAQHPRLRPCPPVAPAGQEFDPRGRVALAGFHVEEAMGSRQHDIGRDQGTGAHGLVIDVEPPHGFPAPAVGAGDQHPERAVALGAQPSGHGKQHGNTDQEKPHYPSAILLSARTAGPEKDAIHRGIYATLVAGLWLARRKGTRLRPAGGPVQQFHRMHHRNAGA